MIRDIIDYGPVEEVLTVISRLQEFLPEYGKTRTDEKFSEHWKACEDLSRELERRTVLMREEAGRLLKIIRRNWTKKQIKEACGYDV